MRLLQIVLIVVLAGALATSGGLRASQPHAVGFAPHQAGATLARSVPAGHVTKLGPTPALPAVGMTVPGLAPEMTSISWPISSPSFGYGFSHYELDYSYDGVNWNVYKNITDQSTTTLGYTWCPNCSMWWDEWTIDSSPVGGYIESYGQLHDLTQPLNATTWFAWYTDSSVWIDWSNPATYGGNVSFVTYELWESVNGSSYGLDTSIGNVSQKSDFLSGLSPDTTYSFFIRTWDHLSDSGVGGLYETNSSVTSFTTPFPFFATAGVNRSTADVGQSLAFVCGVQGGLAPYTYPWAFGDGGNGSGATVIYSYPAPGTYIAECSAYDYTGSASISAVGVTISADPTVTGPVSSPVGSVLEGTSVTFNVSATVGSGGLAYSWAGLPNGCSSRNASNITCDPSGSGTFSIVVTVTDSNGFSAPSAPLNFTVHPAFLGLPATQGYALAGGIAAVAVGAALAVLLVRRRRKKGDAPPPEPPSIQPNPTGPPSEVPPTSSGGGPPPGASP